MIFASLTDKEKQRITRMLDETARTAIESYCRQGSYDHTEASGIVLWIDITQLPECPVEKRDVQDAIWWCEKRGLFTRHPTTPWLVRFHNVAREQYETQADTAA